MKNCLVKKLFAQYAKACWSLIDKYLYKGIGTFSMESAFRLFNEDLRGPKISKLRPIHGIIWPDET